MTEGGYDSDPDIVQRHRQNYRDSNPGVEVAAVEENATARRSIFSSLIGGGKQARSNIGRAINSSTLKTDSKNQGDEDANAYSEISGYLHKRALYASDEGKEWKKRYFETKGNYLVYYRSHKDDKLLAALDLSTVSQIYVLKSQDLEADKPLSTTTSESMKSVMEEACDSIFVLEMSEGQKYLFKAYNNEEATVWVEVLRSIHCKAFKDYGDLDIMFNPMIGRGSGFPSRKTVRDIQSSVEASNKRWCCWPFCRSSTSADSHLQRGKRHDSEIVSIDTQMGKTLAKSVISGSKPRDGEYDENSVSSVHNNPSVDKEHSVRCCC